MYGKDPGGTGGVWQGGVPLGSQKSYPLPSKFCKFCDPIRYILKTLNCS